MRMVLCGVATPASGTVCALKPSAAGRVTVSRGALRSTVKSHDFDAAPPMRPPPVEYDTAIVCGPFARRGMSSVMPSAAPRT